MCQGFFSSALVLWADLELYILVSGQLIYSFTHLGRKLENISIYTNMLLADNLVRGGWILVVFLRVSVPLVGFLSAKGWIKVGFLVEYWLDNSWIFRFLGLDKLFMTLP